MASLTDRDTILALHRRFVVSSAGASAVDDPLVVTRAHGHSVWDVDGRAYLDFDCDAHGVCLGHANAEVVGAMVEQLERGHVPPAATVDRTTAQLAARLAAITPGHLARVLFASSGSEANRTAVAAARAATGRRAVLILKDDTSRTTGRSDGVTDPHETFGAGIRTVAVSARAGDAPCIDEDGVIEASARDVGRLLEAQSGGRIAAVMAEPVGATASGSTRAARVLHRVASLVREAGGLIIVDETRTAWARSGGHLCAADHGGLEPDIMTLGEGAACGAPFGCAVVTPEVAEAVRGETFAGPAVHPAAAAAACATLDLIEQHDLVGNAERQGLRLRAHLEATAADRPFIGMVGGIGLIQFITMVAPDGSRAPDPERASALVRAARRHGLLIGRDGGRSGVVRVTPHLTVDAKEVDLGCRRLASALDEVA